jgi:hypothetical protein
MRKPNPKWGFLFFVIGDHAYITNENLKKLEDAGVDVSWLVDEGGDEGRTSLSPKSYVRLYMEAAKIAVKGLKYKMNDAVQRINCGGYGLFSP